MNTQAVEYNEIKVPPKYKAEVEERVRKYKPATQKSSQIELKIVLTNDKPISCRPRILPIVQQQVDQWMQEKIIRLSSSEYSSQEWW